MIRYLNEMLNLWAQENPEIIEWVRKRDKKYTSPEIQNELVEAMVLGMSRTGAQMKVRSKMKETNRGSVDPRSLAVNLCKTTKQQCIYVYEEPITYLYFQIVPQKTRKDNFQDEMAKVRRMR